MAVAVSARRDRLSDERYRFVVVCGRGHADYKLVLAAACLPTRTPRCVK